MSEVIDLRGFKIKKEEKAVTQTVKSGARNLSPQDNLKEISWLADEYEKRGEDTYWYLAVIGVATVLIILGIFARSYFFIILVVLASLMLFVYAHKEPRKISCTVSTKGIKVGNKFFDYKNLKSFWVFDKTSFKELSLETSWKLNQFIRIPLGDADIKAIKNILKGFLPEKEHEEFITEQLAKILKL